MGRSIRKPSGHVPAACPLSKGVHQSHRAGEGRSGPAEGRGAAGDARPAHACAWLHLRNSRRSTVGLEELCKHKRSQARMRNCKCPSTTGFGILLGNPGGAERRGALLPQRSKRCGVLVVQRLLLRQTSSGGLGWGHRVQVGRHPFRSHTRRAIAPDRHGGLAKGSTQQQAIRRGGVHVYACYDAVAAA